MTSVFEDWVDCGDASVCDLAEEGSNACVKEDDRREFDPSTFDHRTVVAGSVALTGALEGLRLLCGMLEGTAFV
jgi:hypothetical protein